MEKAAPDPVRQNGMGFTHLANILLDGSFRDQWGDAAENDEISGVCTISHNISKYPESINPCKIKIVHQPPNPASFA